MDEPEEILDDTAGLLDHPLTAARVEKFEAWKGLGGEAYPYRFDRTDTAAELHTEFSEIVAGEETGRTAAVAGRVMNVREFGKLSFAVLQDVSGQIQLFVSKGVVGDEEFAKFETLDVGDWVGAAGEVIATKKGELSVRIDSFKLLAKCFRPLPDKFHGLKDLERRYRQRYLDLIVNEEARTTALARAATIRSLRSSFEHRGFLEVETPMLQVKPGGALAKPFVTHHNALDTSMFLRIAPELYLKRLVVGGFEKVFEINRNFRNEGVDTTHNPEFTMLESYEAFADYEDVMRLTEEVVMQAAIDVTGSSVIMYQDREVDLTAPWARLSMLDAISEKLGVAISFEMPLDELRELAHNAHVKVEGSWGPGKIMAELFDQLIEPDLWQPTFVIDYPTEVSPLSKEHRDNPLITERFEAFVVGRELANAFSELNDPVEQRRRFESQAAAKAAGDDEAHPIDEDYILALEYGLPPAGGLGIGVDRLVMLLTDQSTIREVVLFPHLRVSE